jgi:alpha/beta superfamily hydrolase
MSPTPCPAPQLWSATRTPSMAETWTATWWLQSATPLVAAGFAALRFNFRGAGASEGRHDNGRGEREDALRCLHYLQSRTDVADGRLGVAGYSFGGVIASGIGAPVQACVAVSPPSLLAADDVPLLVVTGGEDRIAPSQSLSEAFNSRSEASLEVIPGVDHSWMRGLEEMTALAVAFFKTRL